MLRSLKRTAAKRKLLLLIAIIFVIYCFTFSWLFAKDEEDENDFLAKIRRDIASDKYRKTELLKKVTEQNQFVAQEVNNGKTSGGKFADHLAEKEVENINLEQPGKQVQNRGAASNELYKNSNNSKINSSELNELSESKQQQRLDVLMRDIRLISDISLANEPDYNVHVFYYMWYGTPQFDGQYLHWNHPRLPHWSPREAERWPKDKHVPPDDVGSNFYPLLGPYSSRDPQVLTEHMQQIRLSGAGVLSVSWYPPGQSDDNGDEWDHHIPLLMDIAASFELKVCFHIEPFKGRSSRTLKRWIQYIVDKYGKHSAFYRFSWKGVELPVYYIYDSYHISTNEWKQLLSVRGANSVRGTPYDGLFIGLVVELKHLEELQQAGFNGYYTYFASTKFTYGSSTGHWTNLANFAEKHELLFIPSVGPGYIDTEVRPWNGANTKPRADGQYYRDMFEAAIKVKPYLISITSFNEWHEGTQIENALPHSRGDKKYLDYSPNAPDFYLTLTRALIKEYEEAIGEKSVHGHFQNKY